MGNAPLAPNGLVCTVPRTPLSVGANAGGLYFGVHKWIWFGSSQVTDTLHYQWLHSPL